MPAPKRKRVVISDTSSDSSDGGDDLEKDLLTLAQRKPRQAASKEKTKMAAFSNSDSDSDDNSSDDGKKKKRKNVAPKKPKTQTQFSDDDSDEGNSEPEEGEVVGDEESSGDDEFFDGYDENLMGDDEDRAKLEEMTEKEREQVLYERMERRDALKTRWQIQRRLKQGGKEKQKEKVAAAKRATTSSRQLRAAEKKTESKAALAIQDLKAKREEKKQRQEQKIIKDDVDKGGDDDEDGDKDVEPVKKEPLKASDVYSDDDDDDDDDSKSSSSLSSKSSDSDSSDDESGKSKPIEYISTAADLNLIRLSRFKLERWCHAPFFKDLVTGCFVRVGIGAHMGKSVYRACEIVDVVETAKIYKVGNSRTNKGLKLKFGKAERVFRLEFISNTDVTDSEFEKFRYEHDMSGHLLPTKDFADKKIKEIRKYLDYKFSEEDIQHIVSEKSRFRSTPFNYATKKTDLMHQKMEGEIAGDVDLVRKIENELSELDTRAGELDRARNENTFSVIYINKKNRLRNDMETEKAMLKEAQEARELNKQDPFTRRKCQPVMVTKLKEAQARQAMLSKSKLMEASGSGKSGHIHDEVASLITSAEHLTHKGRKPEKKELNSSVYARRVVTANANAAAALIANAAASTEGDDLANSTDTLNKPSAPKSDANLSDIHSFDLNIDLPLDLNPLIPPQQIRAPILGSGPKHVLNLDDLKRRKGLI